MPVHQNIQQCIQMCHQTAQQLRGMANQATESYVRDKLFEAAHHLDLCVHECNFTMQRAQMQQQMQPPMQQPMMEPQTWQQSPGGYRA